LPASATWWAGQIGAERKIDAAVVLMMAIGRALAEVEDGTRISTPSS
jgi:hypothetical protein